MVDKLIQFQVPNYFVEDYPMFIRFLEQYYKWMGRHRGDYNDEEIEKIHNSFSDLTPNEAIQRTIARIKESGPDEAISNMRNDFILQRIYTEWQARDNDFTTADDNDFLASDHNDRHIEQWLNNTGFKIISEIRTNEVNYKMTGEQYDKVNGHSVIESIGTEYVYIPDILRIIKLLKHINAIKGTEQSIRIFFLMFFGIPPKTIVYPKYDLIIIDGEPSIDTDKVIRDDLYYDEMSIDIQMEDGPDRYQDIFDNFFKSYFAIAGFRYFLT